MRKWLLALVFAATACGAGDETVLAESGALEEEVNAGTADELTEEVIDVPPLPEAEVEKNKSAPWLVKRITVGRSTVEFIGVGVEDEAGNYEPSVIITTKGFYGDPHPIDALRAANSQPLTSAEIYQGLTGEDPPTRLMEAHAMEARLNGRTSEFIEPEKAVVSEKAFEFTWAVSIPGHHHTEVQQFTRQMICGTCGVFNPVTWHVCTGRLDNAAPQRLPEMNSCPRLLTGWIRVGVGNKGTFFPEIPYNATFQQWYRFSNTAAWGVLPAVAAPKGTQYTADWSSTALKVQAYAVSGPRVARDQANVENFTSRIIPN